MEETYARFMPDHELWADRCFHGILEGNVAGIVAEGLRSMARQRVHLALRNTDGSDSSGVRRGSDRVVAVDVAPALADGIVRGMSER